MARIIKKVDGKNPAGENATATVRYNAEWDEYMVDFHYPTRPPCEETRYYTDCKHDAIGTAEFEIERFRRGEVCA